MAALAASAVSLYPAVSVTAGPNSLSVRWPAGKGSRDIVEYGLKLVLTGQGGATNTIGASALGFTTLLSCSVLWDATNSKGYPAVIDPVNNILILLSGADPQAPVDVTTTAAYIRVTGTYKPS